MSAGMHSANAVYVLGVDWMGVSTIPTLVRPKKWSDGQGLKSYCFDIQLAAKAFSDWLEPVKEKGLVQIDDCCESSSYVSRHT
jgi:hypothetical protein